MARKCCSNDDAIAEPGCNASSVSPLMLASSRDTRIASCSMRSSSASAIASGACASGGDTGRLPARGNDERLGDVR